MFPSCEMVPLCKMSDALLLQEHNIYKGWIRLPIHADYKCDSKWLFMITVRQDRRKYSLLVVIDHTELLSSYLYFLKYFSKACWRQEPFPGVCAYLHVYPKGESRFEGSQVSTWDIMQRNEERDSEWWCLEVLGLLGMHSSLYQSVCFFRTSSHLVFCLTLEPFRHLHSQIVGLFLFIQGRFFQAQKGNLSMEIHIYAGFKTCSNIPSSTISFFYMFITKTDAVQPDLVPGHSVFLEDYQPGV